MKEERCPHTRSPFVGRDCGWRRGEASEPRRRAQPQGCGGQSGEIPAQRLGADQHSPAREACLLSRRGGQGLGAEARASVGSQGEDWGWRREHSLKGLAHHSWLGVREKVCSCRRGKRHFLASLFRGMQEEETNSRDGHEPRLSARIP